MLRSEARRMLGVPPGTSPSDVKKAYRRALKRRHPDVGGDPDEFNRTVAAYNLLISEPAVRFVKSPSRWETAFGRLRRLTTRTSTRRVH